MVEEESTAVGPSLAAETTDSARAGKSELKTKGGVIGSVWDSETTEDAREDKLGPMEGGREGTKATGWNGGRRPASRDSSRSTGKSA